MEFYRYQLRTFLDSEEGDPDIELHLITYFLIKETPSGYWIGNEFSKKRWVHKISKKRWAYPTKKEALYNCFLRTKRRIKILKYQLNNCSIGLKLLENNLKE